MSPWTILAGVVLLGAAASTGYWKGHSDAYNAQQVKIEDLQKKDAQALADAQAAARASEQKSAQQIATITQTNEQDKAHAKATYDADLAALRAGTLRLRAEWSCTPALAAGVQSAAASQSGVDANAQLREQSAATLVRNAADADAEIKALQKIIQLDRQP